MKVINTRTGFATNSSSSHSIIYSSDPSTFLDGRNEDGNDFGWGWFLQKSKEDKLKYVVEQYKAMDNREIAEMVGVTEDEVEAHRVTDEYGGIDHESFGLIPHSMAKMIVNNDKFAILGGNDNSEVPSWAENYEPYDVAEVNMVLKIHNEITEGDKKRVVKSTSIGNKVVVEEQVATVFDTYTGRKVRYNPYGTEEVYQSFPELVDIKITDYCPYGCSYCYQDSTLSGQHADFDELKSMVDFLRSNGAFELAIGGGEPTLYPHFEELIEYCNKEDGNGLTIVPNFTTRNLSVFKRDVEETHDLLKSIGGFAFSVDDSDDVKKFERLVDYWIDVSNSLVNDVKLDNELYKDYRIDIAESSGIIKCLMKKISIQVVLGSLDREEYINIAKQLNHSIGEINKKLDDMRNNIESLKEILRAYYNREENKNKRVNLYIPYPFNTVLGGNVPTLMLLGYKTTGRASQPEYDYTHTAIKDILMNHRLYNIGIDTSAAQQMQPQLEELEVDPTTYYIKEGVASCYIDAVNGTMAASSYNDNVANDDMDIYDSNTFTETFNSYQKMAMNAIPIFLSE